MRRWAKLIGLTGLLLWAGWAGAGELNWQGQMIQGGLLIGRVAPGTRLELDGQPLPVAPDGAFVVGFGRDAPPQARLSALFPDGLRQDRILTIAQR
ncbi:MAG: M23 family peptidase, partial [Candidatus Contendobacter sp.]|nr:M23 family peptidase [Candidatus Contendobacter sp.]